VSQGGSFTERVRQELSRVDPADDAEAHGELAVVLRLAGRFHRVGSTTGSRTTLEVASTSGAVVRRVFGLLPRAQERRPQLWVREPGGVRTSTTYGLVLEDGVDVLARDLGLVDADGRPTAGLPSAPPDAAVRGALLTVAALSDPRREVHAELRVPARAVAEDLAGVLRGLGVAGHVDPVRERLVVKSGEGLARLLEVAGAVESAAEISERRRRRRLRNDATRLANADAANLRRTIEAAQSQLDVVERAVAAVGWAGLGEELRTLALARLVNPTASLAELGELCEPPIGKSAVHRRMRRIAELAESD
jgi:DNA-binding protein WhiA